MYSNDEFDSTESDELLDDLMPPVEDTALMDTTNQVCTSVTSASCMVSQIRRLQGSVIIA